MVSRRLAASAGTAAAPAAPVRARPPPGGRQRRRYSIHGPRKAPMILRHDMFLFFFFRCLFRFRRRGCCWSLLRACLPAPRRRPPSAGCSAAVLPAAACFERCCRSRKLSSMSSVPRPARQQQHSCPCLRHWCRHTCLISCLHCLLRSPSKSCGPPATPPSCAKRCPLLVKQRTGSSTEDTGGPCRHEQDETRSHWRRRFTHPTMRDPARDPAPLPPAAAAGDGPSSSAPRAVGF